MTNPLVSIMMPAYNAEQFIGEAIESVLSQTYTNWELVIVNDGSTDDTATIASSYRDPRIKLVHQSNGGESVARNTALDHMQGDYVAFLDADDFYRDNHLKVTIEYLCRHRDVDGVYTDGHYYGQDNKPLQTLQSWRRGPFEGKIFEEIVRAPDVFGPPLCVVIRSRLISQYNLRFDPKIIIGPDWDFFIRYSVNAIFRYVDQNTCVYRLHTTSISSTTDNQRRLLDFAACRIKAIQIEDFKNCSLETQTAVFYDLLINLLVGFPDRQAAITESRRFQELPEENRAKSYRLMASKSIVAGVDETRVKEWLHHSVDLDPQNIRGKIISLLFDLTPNLCKSILRIRNLTVRNHFRNSPFAKSGTQR
jgi:glycosyltransferase involved in cell wall biosynthesis